MEVSEGHLATVWCDIGRPGTAKLAAAMRQRGFKVSPQRINNFDSEQPIAQVCQGRLPSKGKVTAASRDSRWQADTINFSARNAEVDRGDRYALVVVEIWSRMVRAEPTKDLCVPTVLAAWRAMRAEFGNRRPLMLDTVVCGEFGGVFGAALHAEGIVHIQRDPRHKDALAVVDPAIARLKQAMGK